MSEIAAGPALRWLRVSLVCGAAYDAAFAALMVLAPRLPARLLRLPLPGESFYLWILAILLGMLAALYVSAARQPLASRAIVDVAIVGRLGGAGALALGAVGRPDLAGLYALAAADFLFGTWHALASRPLRA